MRCLDVPHAPSSASVVRRAVADDLRSAGIGGDVLHDVALVLSELVGNAVRHGSPLPGATVRVTWEVRPERVHVQVQDGGRPGASRLQPEVGASRPDAEGGRGLGIVGVVSAAWGVRSLRDGLAVWADLLLVPSPAGR